MSKIGGWWCESWAGDIMWRWKDLTKSRGWTPVGVEGSLSTLQMVFLSTYLGQGLGHNGYGLDVWREQSILWGATWNWNTFLIYIRTPQLHWSWISYRSWLEHGLIFSFLGFMARVWDQLYWWHEIQGLISGWNFSKSVDNGRRSSVRNRFIHCDWIGC